MKVQLFRLQSDVGDIRCCCFFNFKPEFLFIVRVFVLYITIKVRHKLDSTGEVEWRHRIANRADFMTFNANKANGFNLYLFTVSKYSYKTTGQSTFLHVQFTNKIFHFTVSKIKYSIIDRYVDPDPVSAV
ncbi:hypothetical protein D3C78_865130 [compost metagenome]